MILLVDKPAGMTSQNVVSKIKHASARKLKIGHTGTLDPMCTGLLPVLTGRDTKLTQFFPHTKAYLASIRFGVRTTTGDVTGQTIAISALPSSDLFRDALPSMVGAYEQVPPMYSAVHVNGKRLYELARMGVEVERTPRMVEIFSLSYVDQIAEDEFRFSVVCSSGTYIRTLCEDIASNLGLCATMSALRRTSSNGFSLDDAYSLDKMLLLAEQGRLEEVSVSSEKSFSYLPAIHIPKNGETYYCNGGLLTCDRVSLSKQTAGMFRAYSELGQFLGLASVGGSAVKSVFLAEF